MANRDHSLDDKIINSAREIFLRDGFEKASLKEIASGAGTTTGALYTRYEGKDDLFQSLFSDLLKEVSNDADSVNSLYMEAERNRDIDGIIKAIRNECELYLDMLFKYYDDCKLLIAKSRGSRIGEMIDRLWDKKAQDTAAYFKAMSGGKDTDADAVELLIRIQADQFRCILEKGWDKERALKALRTAEIYQEAGWRALFEAIL